LAGLLNNQVNPTSLEEDESQEARDKTILQLKWVLNNKTEERLKYANHFKVPSRYAMANMKDFEGTFEEEPNFDKNEAGIFISGSPGSGKTHLAVAMMFWNATRIASMGRSAYETKINLPDTALFESAPELLASIRRTFGQKQQEEDLVSSISRVPLLVLDDIGSERATDWTAEIICRIVTNRINFMRPTIVTSNLKLGELHHSDPRLASRLGEMNYIHLGEVDLRQAKSEQFRLR